MTAQVAILGAGGHARVVADILMSMAGKGADLTIAGFIAPEGDAWLDIPLLGDDAALAGLVSSGAVSHFIVGVGSTCGGQPLRRRLASIAADAGALPISAIHPAAVIGREVVILPGTAVMALAAVNAGSRIGRHVIVNTGACIDHDAVVGDFAHLAPRSVLSGNVRVGNNALVGVGACVRQGISIGSDATLGAGAVAVSDIADGVTAKGIPAR
ncbi:acetyltransferase [Glycocaulis abyssi]|uniref:Acetyltransferase n=1 Tax=Glycocaulis abyssi TaxID=1433403 RepID=A0ABV9N811_9PROT